MKERGKVLHRRRALVKSGVWIKALLSAALLGQSAFAQESDPAHLGGESASPYVVPHRLDTPDGWIRDAEYLANWGLDLSGFDGAYALGAYGQNVKVGVLDDGTWSGHQEFALRNNVLSFGEPFGDTGIPEISSAGSLNNHGLHVAGIIGANRDGNGMHGGAFRSTIYAGVGVGGGSKLIESGAVDAITKSGISFLNNSWAHNFENYVRYPTPTSASRTIPEYAIPMVIEINGEAQTGYYGPDITTSARLSPHRFRGDQLKIENMRDISLSGIVNVFGAGNDHSDRPLFRGIAPSIHTATLPYVLARGAWLLENSVSTAGYAYQDLSKRLAASDALQGDVADRIAAYRNLVAYLDRVAPENKADPRIVRLDNHVRLLLEPVDGYATAYEKLVVLRSDAAWETKKPAGFSDLEKIRDKFNAIASLTEADVNGYIADAKEYIAGLDVITKLHPSFVAYQTELAALEADRDLYKREKFEPTERERALLKSIRTQDDFRKLEKHWLTVVNLSQDERISPNSNICGISKYYCISGPGGAYSQAPDGGGMIPTPAVPQGTLIFDQRGKAVKDTILASDYQIFSLGITTNAAAGATNAAKQAGATSAYQMMAGTSMATPHATAGLAVIKSRFPYLDNAQVRDVLLSTAKDIGAPGIDRVYGWGEIDIEKSMGGPAKFWQLGRDYDFTDAEKRAAEKYNAVVAKADYLDRSLPQVIGPALNDAQALDRKVQDLTTEISNATAEANKAAALVNEARGRNDKETDKAQTELYNTKSAEVEAKKAERKIIEAQRDEKAEFVNGEVRRAREAELTRDQPNEPDDNKDKAFRDFDFRVNIPGKRTAECDHQACIADYWTNDIDGPGGLTKLGQGALALTGNNTYAGGTRIEEGVLQLGMGGSSGSVTGDIVNKAVLAFDRSDELVFSDVISGRGALEVYGGTLRLKNANTYSGDTAVYGGLLAVDGSIESSVKVNKGGRLGGTGRVGALVVNEGGIVAPGGAVGTLSVAGDLRFEPGGLYEVDIAKDRTVADRLDVGGSATLLGGTVEVRMEGDTHLLDEITTKELLSKRFDILTAKNGVTNTFAAVSPQYNYITAQLDYASPDRVTLYFDLTQQPKSEEAKEKQAELDERQRELDRLAALPEPGSPEQGTAQVEPATGRAGEGAGPINVGVPPEDRKASIAALQAEVERRRLELLELRFRELDLVGAASPNQISVGEGVKSLGIMSGNPLVDELLGSKRGATPDFDSLSGEIHPTLQGVLMADSQFITRAAIERLRVDIDETPHNRSAPASRLGYWPTASSEANADRAFAAIASPPQVSVMWGQAYGGWADVASDGNASGYTSSSGGFAAGMDGTAGDNWRVGMLFGVGDLSLNTKNGKASVDSYRMGLYAGTEIEQFKFRFGANYAWHQIDTRRQAHWFNLTENNRAEYGARSAELYGELGYEMQIATIDLEPFISATHVRLDTDSFKETGAIAGIAAQGGATDATFTTLGLRASHEIMMSDELTLSSRGMLGWTNALGETPHASHSFVGGDPFAVLGLPLARNSFVGEIGVGLGMGRNANLNLTYSARFARGIADSGIKANFQLKF